MFAQRLAPRAVLIPGCGSAQEAGWLAQAGWPVRAIDFAAQAVAAAKAQLGAHADVVEQADFFQYRPPFDVQW
ncbi:SAM-dependent methyltransferase, partial [Burkholderia cenocepacia]|nr:SAM-dependent methyltransferase [Burkholderia cenocepacia]